MKRLVPYILIAWIPFTIELFALLKPRRAVLAAFLAGWMFLPLAPYVVAGNPGSAKVAVVCLAVLLGMALVDFRRLASLRFSWVDVPILLFCLVPFASSMVNGLGVREGLSAVFSQAVAWGIPYGAGRLYFDELPSLRELATGIFAGGIVYTPLVLFEAWKGSHLNQFLYGYEQTSALRPKVFMDNDLMVALWLAAAVVLGFWLWRSGARPSLFGIPLGWWVTLLLAALILERCMNGWILMLLGAGLLVVCSWWRSSAPVFLVAALIILHLTLRGSGLWSGRQAVSAIALASRHKANSIAYRFRYENLIAENARQHPILGWGRQPKVLYNERANEAAVCDAFWMLTFAEFGVVGLIGLWATLLCPVVLFLRRFPPAQWNKAEVAPAAALAVVLVIYMTDHLANTMINPVYMLAAGGLTEIAARSASRASIPR